ncbi:MAG: DMT family transporter [Terracidiphilus sp.]
MALKDTLKARWFWYSMACVLCWGGWAFLSKLGSREIPAEPMQFVFTIGTLPVCILLLIARRFKLEKSPKGITYGVLNGVLSGVGGLALFAAYHTNGNTSMITVATSLYPVITVVLALAILHEHLKLVQALGLAFAAIAMIIFSI